MQDSCKSTPASPVPCLIQQGTSLSAMPHVMLLEAARGCMLRPLQPFTPLYTVNGAHTSQAVLLAGSLQVGVAGRACPVRGTWALMCNRSTCPWGGQTGSQAHCRQSDHAQAVPPSRPCRTGRHATPRLGAEPAAPGAGRLTRTSSASSCRSWPCMQRWRSALLWGQRRGAGSTT